MQLKEKDGIACDRCGTTFRTDFMYYSFDFRLLNVANNMRPGLSDIFRTQITFSLDICVVCFEKIKDDVIKHYASTMNLRKKGSRNRPAPPQIVCELTGAKLIGTFNYYHCNVTKADVKMSGQPNVCVSCQTQTETDDIPCKKCGGLDFVRLAISKTDDRFLEINISEAAFRNMVDKAETIRKVAGEWATKS